MRKNGKPTTNETLWANLKALMERDYGEENLQRLQRETHIGGGAARIKKGNTSFRIATIEKIATRFRVEVWQLLVPGLNDVKFIDVLRAWNDTDERGRRMIYNASQGALQEDGSGEPTPSQRGRDRAARGV